MIVYVNPTTLYGPPRINVLTELHNNQDVRGASVVSGRPLTISRLRAILAVMFSRREFDLFDQYGAPIDYMADIPNVVIMRGGVPDTTPDTVQVQVPDGRTLEVGFGRDQNHLQFLQIISNMIGVPTTDFVLVDHNDVSWIFPFDLAVTTAVRVHLCRGGMRRQASRSRSVSPTEEFRRRSQIERRLMPELDLEMEGQADEEYQQPEEQYANVENTFIEEEHHVEEQESGQDQNVIAREDMSRELPPWELQELGDTEYNITCWLHPGDFPPAQPNLMKKEILEEGVVISSVWAPARVRTRDILRYLHTKLHPAYPFRVVPAQAEYWETVQHVLAPERVTILAPLTFELRTGLWEYFQPVRVVPLLQQDQVTARILLPRPLSPSIAADRVAAAADFDQHWTLHMLGSQWLVVNQRLPEHLYRIIRQGAPGRRYLRGGGRKSNAPRIDPRRACVGWAAQRIGEVVPAANSQTVNMLLRGEFKLATAIMQCRTTEQVRHCLAAAYRRSGLSPPPGTPGAPSQPEQTGDGESYNIGATDGMHAWLGQMAATLTRQTEIMTIVTKQQMEAPNRSDLGSMDIKYEQRAEETMKALQDMSTTIDKLVTKMDHWETYFLPHILDRLPEQPPPSPSSSVSEKPHRSSPYNMPAKKIESKDQLKDKQAHKDQGGPEAGAEAVTSADAVGTLQVLEAASLKAQCAKVVASNNPQALHPFKARK